MKKILYISIFMLALCSCSRYDDTAIWDELREHEQRIGKLEQLCRRLNEDIAAQQGVVAALQGYDYVTGVSDIIEDGVVVGYTVNFHKGEPVNIYHGHDGADGADGIPGADGTDGADGADGRVPVIGVAMDADGQYYWTLDGEWIIGEDGEKIPVNGVDGVDGAPGADGADGDPGADGVDGVPGADGADGKDGVAPQLKIEEGYWYVSYDGGVSWEQLYKAVAEDGKDGDSFFSSIDTSDPDYIIITFTSGEQIQLPTWKAFVELQARVNELNTNILALQSIIAALQDKDYVTDILPVIEDGAVIGYTLVFAKNLPVTIYHGKDGADGENGEDGEDCVEGADGHTPVIGVKQEADGTYYWTVNGEWMLSSPDIQFPSGGDSYWVIDGEWLLDENGNKVPATGFDGKDGVTPQLKIENGCWYVSYDGGKTWSKDSLGVAGSGVEDAVFSDMSYDEDFLYLYLKNGETIIVPRHAPDSADSYSISVNGITHHSVTLVGKLEQASEEFAYSQVKVYFSEVGKFNIHTAQSASTQEFDYNGRFSLCIDGLAADTAYEYCVCIETVSEEIYGTVETFKTSARNAQVLDLSRYEAVGGYIAGNYGSTQWTNSSTTYFHYQIPLADLDDPTWFTITANASQKAYVAFFKEKATSKHNAFLPPYAAGWDIQVTLDAGATRTFDVPYDAEYIYIRSIGSSTDYTPSLIEFGK